MKQASASAMKGSFKGTYQSVPREGTKIRAIYDLFYNNKGRVVDFCSTNLRGARMVYVLIDEYGMDIRRIKKNKWCLVGEWFGKTYVDYTQ